MGVEGGGDSELAEDVLDVLFDRAVGYPEGLCDAGVRLPLGHEREHLAFSWRERVEGVCPLSGREQFDDELGSRTVPPSLMRVSTSMSSSRSDTESLRR